MRKSYDKCVIAKCKSPIDTEGYCGRHHQEMLSRWNSPVYFLKAGNYVKIGYSKNPKKRKSVVLSEGTVGRPSDITDRDLHRAEVIATESGGPTREARLHSIFRRDRIVGEWFTYSPDLEEYIDSLPLAPKRATPYVSDPLNSDLEMVALLDKAETAYKARRLQDKITGNAMSQAFFEARSGGCSASQIAIRLGRSKGQVEYASFKGEGDEWLGQWFHKGPDGNRK